MPVSGVFMALDQLQRNGSASMSWVWWVNPADIYDFGCGVYPGANFVGTAAVCRVAWFCHWARTELLPSPR
jgi:hypothetical protein